MELWKCGNTKLALSFPIRIKGRTRRERITIPGAGGYLSLLPPGGELLDRIRGGGDKARQDVRDHHSGLRHILGAPLCGHPDQHQPGLAGGQEFSITRGEERPSQFYILNTTKEFNFRIIGFFQKKIFERNICNLELKRTHKRTWMRSRILFLI